MDQTTAIKLASQAYTLAYALNADEATSGAPCRAAFDTAHNILIAGLEDDGLAVDVHEHVIDSGEYTPHDIERHLLYEMEREER